MSGENLESHQILSGTSSVSDECISSELQELRNRAKRLSENLKSLSLETESMKAATANEGVGPDGEPVDKQSEEIKAIMKRYSDIIGLFNFLSIIDVNRNIRS